MARVESSRRVFLIGFMGAGKTAVGRMLARRLDWTFRDLDEVIEDREGKSVAAIFAQVGETGFRRIESAVLKELLNQGENAAFGNLVIALGGGTFVQAENRAALERAGGITVLLQASLEELRQRCRQDGKKRPLAQDEARFEQLFAERRAAYERAQFRVETAGKTVGEVAAEVERIVASVTQPEVKL